MPSNLFLRENIIYIIYDVSAISDSSCSHAIDVVLVCHEHDLLAGVDEKASYTTSADVQPI